MIDNFPERNQGQGVVLGNIYIFFSYLSPFPKSCGNKIPLGMLTPSKMEIPMGFLPNKNKEDHSSTLGFVDDVTLVSYVPEENRSVISLSVQHREKYVCGGA
jgi:hypothetical protein